MGAFCRGWSGCLVACLGSLFGSSVTVKGRADSVFHKICFVIVEWIRKFDLRKAGLCSAAIGGVNVMVHILVIANIIPYLWVNGGRTESFAVAQQTSLSSIGMTIINILIALIASQIIPVKLNKFWGIVLSTFLIITLPLTLVGVIQQFLGTIFERCVMGMVTIIGFCADTRIAFEKRW